MSDAVTEPYAQTTGSFGAGRRDTAYVQAVMPYIPNEDTAARHDITALQSMVASIANQQQLMQLQLNQFVMMQEKHNKRTTDQLSYLTEAMDDLLARGSQSQYDRNLTTQSQILSEVQSERDRGRPAPTTAPTTTTTTTLPKRQPSPTRPARALDWSTTDTQTSNVGKGWRDVSAVKSESSRGSFGVDVSGVSRQASVQQTRETVVSPVRAVVTEVESAPPTADGKQVFEWKDVSGGASTIGATDVLNFLPDLSLARSKVDGVGGGGGGGGGGGVNASSIATPLRTSRIPESEDEFSPDTREFLNEHNLLNTM